MRKFVPVLALAALLAGCGSSGVGDRARPDEFAVSRQAPLVIPPDFSLTPPSPGSPRPQDSSPSTQALNALYGGVAARSEGETSTLREAGREEADAGVRSQAGDPDTNVVDKGAATRDIVAAQAQDSPVASATTPQ